MKKQRIKAFTILEVTITMLIVGLLIGITYTSYSIIIQSYHSFTSKNDDMAILVTLDHLLKRDFTRAETITKTPNGINLTWAGNVVDYKFTADFVIRSATRIDTFKVLTRAVNTTFENLPISEITDTDEQSRLDQLDFTLIFQNEKIPYHYHKLYSSVNLIQRNPNAIN